MKPVKLILMLAAGLVSCAVYANDLHSEYINHIKDLSPFLPSQGRAVFRYVINNYDYSLTNEVAALRKEAEIEPVATERLIASLLASLVGIPREQTESTAHELIEIGFIRNEKHADERRYWSQYYSRFYDDNMSWLLKNEQIPSRMTIFKDGVEHHWDKRDEQWETSELLNGIYLIPDFYNFGTHNNIVKGDYYDTNKWVVSASDEGDKIKIVWNLKTNSVISDREVGILIDRHKNGIVYKSWRGRTGEPTTISTYSNFFVADGGHYFPKHTTIIKQLPLRTNLVIKLRDEHYIVINTNVSFGSTVDTGLFDPSYYPWSTYKSNVKN